VDQLDDKTNGNASPGEESRPRDPDPIIQPRDGSGGPRGAAQPIRVVPRVGRVLDGTLAPFRSAGPAGPGQAAPSAYDIAESMFRFKWTAVLVFVLVAAPLIAAIWTQVVPKYQARAEVRIRPIIPRLVFRTEDNGMIPLYSDFVNTQVSVMRGMTVLQRVLARPDVQATQWYKNPPKSLVQRLQGNPISTMERLRDDLSAQPRNRTEIIDVSFTAVSPKEAKLITEAVLDEYKKYTTEKANATEDTLYRQLVDQYNLLQDQITSHENVCAKLRKSLGTENPQDVVSTKRARLDETQARLDDLQQKIAVLQWQLKQAGPNDANAALIDANGVVQNQPKYYQDQEWRKLDLNLKTIRHNIANSILTPKNPDMIRMEKDKDFAEQLLDQREKQLDEQWRDRLSSASGGPIDATAGNASSQPTIPVEQQLAQAKEQQNLLLAEINKQKTDLDSLFGNVQLLEKESSALQHSRELFDAVRQRLDQKRMEQNVPGSIEVPAEAFVPSQPYNDRRMVFTAMALCMALGMGGAAAFLRASRNQAIYAPKDMPYSMQVPFLGYIPLTRTKSSTVGSLRSRYIEMQRNQSSMIESVRIVRTALLSRLDDQGGATVLITSAAAGTGKSSFTLNLGKSLAQAGKKVLLIDADFQKMTLTTHFKNLSDKPGFIQYLRSKSACERHIFLTETSGLSIMPAGTRDKNGQVLEEIANGSFQSCMGKLHKQYNIILLDSSPILPLADSIILSRQVDGAIFVERQRVSSRADLDIALQRLGTAGGHLLGTVFIGSNSHQRYGYDYSSYGKIHES
jgi:polysaccharide biosynthesis transport protein